MNRRAMLFGAVALVPVVATAGLWDSIKTIVGGHTRDIATRFTDDEIIEGMVTAMGTMDETADGQDAAHWATGDVSVVNGEDGKRYIQLMPNFNSGPLPDGHVYFSSTRDINNENDFFGSLQHEAGPLKKGKGASYYEVPVDANIKSVTIWCKAFSQYIGSADIG